MTLILLVGDRTRNFRRTPDAGPVRSSHHGRTPDSGHVQPSFCGRTPDAGHVRPSYCGRTPDMSGSQNKPDADSPVSGIVRYPVAEIVFIIIF